MRSVDSFRHCALGLHLLRLVYLIGMPNCDPLKKREGDNALALGGWHFTINTNNQPIFGVSDRVNDRGYLGRAGRVGGCCTIILGLANLATKNSENIIHCGLRQPPETIFRHKTNQKHSGMANEEKNRMRNQWGAWGEAQFHHFGDNELGGDKN